MKSGSTLGGRAHLGPADLLGRDVGGRAHQHSRLREARDVLALVDEGEPEVEHDRAIAAADGALQEDVLGLQIAVDQREVVRGDERLGDLPSDVERARERQRRKVIVDEGAQRRADQALHHEKEPPLVLAAIGYAATPSGQERPSERTNQRLVAHAPAALPSHRRRAS
ncbi:MAG TPA: hypothetical protein VIL20_02555 [Sandaracinaceae bacterium]